MVMRCTLMYGFEIVQLTGGHLEVAELRILRFSMGVTTMEGVEISTSEGGDEGWRESSRLLKMLCVMLNLIPVTEQEWFNNQLLAAHVFINQIFS